MCLCSLLFGADMLCSFCSLRVLQCDILFQLRFLKTGGCMTSGVTDAFVVFVLKWVRFPRCQARIH
jgi:hypothetical protein